MWKSKIEGSRLYYISLFILLILSSVVIVPAILFTAKITISIFTTILSLILAITLYCYLTGINKKSLTCALIAILLIVAILFISGMIFDSSYDGMTYHKSAVGAMKDGWNPFFGSIDEWAMSNAERSGLNHYGLWVDHYPKATWIIGASFYSITGNIETGKAFTILMMIVCFGMLSNLLIKHNFRKWQAYIVSLIAAVNPITLAQAFTYYNDGMLMLTLFVTIILLTDLYYKMDNKVLIILIANLIICVNMKFTGLAYAFVFCLGYAVLMIIKSRKQTGTYASLQKVIKSLTAIVFGVLISVIFVSPYVTNFAEHGHPLYPLAGKEKIDIMEGNQPESFKYRSSTVKIFYSIFSHSEDLKGTEINEPQLKAPFYVTSDDIAKLSVPDLRIGGFGVFFGPIAIISTIIIIIAIYHCFVYSRAFLPVLLMNSIVVGALMLFISESWWARYSGYFYGLIIMALIFLFDNYNRNIFRKSFFKLLLPIVFSILIFANTILFFPVNRIQTSIRYTEEIKKLHEISQTDDIEVLFGGELAPFTGIYNNLIDKGINFKVRMLYDNDELTPLMDGHIFYNKISK